MPGLALAWHKLHRRTKWLAELLGLKLIHMPEPPPYIRSALRTIGVLCGKPGLVLVQGTHGPLLFLAASLKRLMGYTLVVDAHSGMFIPFGWKSYLLTLPFRGFLKRADLVILHEPTIAEEAVRGLALGPGKALVLYDPPPPGALGPVGTPEGGPEGPRPLKLIFPSGGLADEPIRELVEVVNGYGGQVELIITGPHEPRREGKAFFTGYLPYGEYLGLLRSSDAVLALTKLEYTVLGACWEALYYAKPLITSRTKALRRIFGRAAIYIRGPEELPDVLRKLETEPGLLGEKAKLMEELRGKILAEHEHQVRALLSLLASLRRPR